MKGWAQTWLAVVVLAPAAYAAAAVTIELPDVELQLPRVSPPYFQKEGLPYITDNELVTEILRLFGRQDYEGALAAAREQYAAEMTLLETGDPDGAVGRRAGPGRLPIPVPSTGNEISATVLYLIGQVYLQLERTVPAEAALKAALVPLPDYLRVHESLGILYVREERYAEAREHLARAAELGLNTAGLHKTLGFINLQTANYWGAISAYQQALTMDQDDRGAQSALLSALDKTNQYSAALSLVEQMLQDTPDNPDLWLWRAHLSLNVNQRESALMSLETAIRLGDDSAANKQVCATLHMERGGIGRAVELLKSAAAADLDVQFIDQALARLGYEDEWDYFRELLAALDARASSLTDTQRSRLLTRRAGLQTHDGNGQAARTSLQEAVELDPSNGEALIVLADAYRTDRDYTRAELMYERASTFELYRENALVSLAQLAIDREDFERALALLRAVVSRNPARADLQRNLETLENLVLATSD
jgi:tetratricopeptide (TPR) repeat protein